MSHALPHARSAVMAAASWAVVWLAVAALMVAGCAASKPKPTIAPPPPALDASYDWHVLLLAPFGSVLKDIPLTLHEVLLFRDEAASAAPADDPECYAVNGTGPRFIARTPSEYLLCFKHDRLSRIEATVRLPQNEAARIFADACGLWMKTAQAPNAIASESAQVCEGSDGSVVFVAHLESMPDEEETLLTVQLDASDFASDHAADHTP
jgi:hypothetical protein